MQQWPPRWPTSANFQTPAWCVAKWFISSHRLGNVLLQGKEKGRIQRSWACATFWRQKLGHKTRLISKIVSLRTKQIEYLKSSCSWQFRTNGTNIVLGYPWKKHNKMKIWGPHPGVPWWSPCPWTPLFSFSVLPEPHPPVKVNTLSVPTGSHLCSPPVRTPYRLVWWLHLTAWTGDRWPCGKHHPSLFSLIPGLAHSFCPPQPAAGRHIGNLGVVTLVWSWEQNGLGSNTSYSLFEVAYQSVSAHLLHHSV